MIQTYKIGILLDDLRTMQMVKRVSYPKCEKLIIVRNHIDFVKCVVKLTKDGFDDDWWIAFDHDLGIFDKKGLEINGLHCMKWLCRYLMRCKNVKLPYINSHSDNPSGAENIRLYWRFWLRIEKNIPDVIF